MFNLRLFMQKIVIGILLILAGQVALAQPPDWFLRIKKISILETDRKKVENLLVGAKSVHTQDGSLGTRIRYTYRDTRLSIHYASGACDPDGLAIELLKIGSYPSLLV